MERAPEVPVGGVEQPHATTVGPRADTLATDTPVGGAALRQRRRVGRPEDGEAQLGQQPSNVAERGHAVAGGYRRPWS
ncbi:hypothetical protein GCM10009858_26180 [Terrabacter carboxydivorans]|uniref:Uncharacterized protein n=1 Tax=Terrabacter carboxydivorans TaxID=619730 RepID=A0ABN3LMH4_9MICO